MGVAQLKGDNRGWREGWRSAAATSRGSGCYLGKSRNGHHVRHGEAISRHGIELASSAGGCDRATDVPPDDLEPRGKALGNHGLSVHYASGWLTACPAVGLALRRGYNPPLVQDDFGTKSKCQKRR